MVLLPTKQPVRLDNTRCPYCDVLLTPENWSREHVIGRRFLPKGKLKGRWNLIVRACRRCNGWKSDLEDDISAITLQPTVRGQFARSEPDMIAEARRKGARSISRRTGKPVEKSNERILVEFAQPGVKMTFQLVAQPQVEAERVFGLAMAQVAAFCLFLSYDKTTRMGAASPEDIYPIDYSFRPDWGNAVQRGFIDQVVAWEPRLWVGTGDGLFKVAIRRHPTATCWSWALEWNGNLRVIGLFGAAEATVAVGAALPKIEASWLQQVDGSRIASRVQRALDPVDDRMFYWSEPDSTGRSDESPERTLTQPTENQE